MSYTVKDLLKLNESYHAAGTVDGLPFSIHTGDVYSYKDAAKQNPHLTQSHIKAIVDHTETDEFVDGEKHTSKQHGHTVKVTHNGGHAD